MKRMVGERGKAIAVFDSGVGGLTVFRALRRAMPRERLIYFGDTARLPYGSKTKEAVTRFSLEIGRFLCKRDIKMMVVACNSASALALPKLKAALKVPVIGVIAPAARAAARALPAGKVYSSPAGTGRAISRLVSRGSVGVIGTEATIASRAYQSALRRLAGGIRVSAEPCPLLVPLVEEGWWEHPVTASVARHYLRPLKRYRPDVLILGCTHYPLIKPLLRRQMGAGVRLIDSGEEAAREVSALLKVRGIQRVSGRGGEEFFVTDGPRRFRKLASRILGRPVARVRVARLPL